MLIQLYLPQTSPRVVSLRLHAALGASLHAEIEVATPEPLEGEDLVGAPARTGIHSNDGTVAAHHGIVSSLTLHAKANPDAQRQATIHIRSAIEFLAHRKNAGIFRDKTAVTIHAALRAGRAKVVLTSEGKIKLLGSEVTIDAPREVRIASARVEIP